MIRQSKTGKSVECPKCRSYGNVFNCDDERCPMIPMLDERKAEMEKWLDGIIAERFANQP